MIIRLTEITCAKCLEPKQRSDFPRSITSQRIKLCVTCRKIQSKESKEKETARRSAEFIGMRELFASVAKEVNDEARSNNQKVMYNHATRIKIEDELASIKRREEYEL